MLSICGSRQEGSRCFKQKDWGVFPLLTVMVGYPQKNARSLPPARECLCPSWPAQITHAEVCRGRQDGQGGIPSPEPANGCSRSICPSPRQPWRSGSAGRTRSSRAQPRREPECQHVMNTLSPVTSLHRRGEGNQISKGRRQQGPEFPGAAAPWCLPSSKRRVKVFALGSVIKDIRVLLSHALFFFVFLINCKPHPGC